MTVGVIGLGAMGKAMAVNLVRNGVPVVAYDPVPDAARAFAEIGGTTTASVDELVASTTLILCVVSNKDQVGTVVCREDGQLRAFQRDSVFLCCSTVSADFVRSISSALAAGGVALVDAPLSGGPARALDGTMTMLLSGPSAALAAAKPILDVLAGENQFVVGEDVGTATSFKLVNQVLAAGNLAVGCEAVALAERLGLDLKAVLDVIAVSAGNSWMLQNVVRRHITRDYVPARSGIDIFLKDVKLIREVADESGAFAPITTCVQGILADAVSEGFAGMDGSVLAKYFSQHGRGEVFEPEPGGKNRIQGA